MKPAIVSIISNPDGFIEASPIMISVSPAILDGFADIIPLASGMKSVSKTVFSILQGIIDGTARILCVAEIIISNRRQIPSNQRMAASPSSIIISVTEMIGFALERII